MAGYQDFPSKNFCLTGPKTSAGESFSVSPISVKGTFYASEGCHGFPSKVFCLRVPNSFVGERVFAVFKKISGSEKLYGQKMGVSRISDENFLFHSAENFRN